MKYLSTLQVSSSNFKARITTETIHASLRHPQLSITPASSQRVVVNWTRRGRVHILGRTNVVAAKSGTGRDDPFLVFYHVIVANRGTVYWPNSLIDTLPVVTIHMGNQELAIWTFLVHKQNMALRDNTEGKWTAISAPLTL